MRICFELLELLKAHKKSIRRAAINTFGFIAKVWVSFRLKYGFMLFLCSLQAIGPHDVLATLLNNLKVQERQLRVCTTVAIAIVAETCAPFTVLPAIMNEYRVPEMNVQNGVLKALSFMFEVCWCRDLCCATSFNYVYVFSMTVHWIEVSAKVPLPSLSLIVAMQQCHKQISLDEICLNNSKVAVQLYTWTMVLVNLIGSKPWQWLTPNFAIVRVIYATLGGSFREAVTHSLTILFAFHHCREWFTAFVVAVRSTNSRTAKSMEVHLRVTCATSAQEPAACCCIPAKSAVIFEFLQNVVCQRTG